MASSFEKSVKGATKIKLAPPKSKYVEHILVATHGGEAGVAEIFRALQNRLRDSTWTIVFKSLIVIHFMIREGEPDVTLRYLSNSPQQKLAINSFTEVQTQGRNIRFYAEYLHQRAISFRKTKVDYVRGGEGRLKRLSIEKGLLRETESVQDQIKALLRCDLLSEEPENEITLTAFRLLTMDLLVLYNAMNEGTINILEHYFELSRPDAERALQVYKSFAKQTDYMVRHLSIARQYQYATRLEIPKIKHAPTSLAASLEEYLNDKDFEVNRRQYLAKQNAKPTLKLAQGLDKPASVDKQTAPKASATTTSTTLIQSKPAKREEKGPAPDLIDFFESIEQNQQTMAQPHHAAQVQTQGQFSQPPSNTLAHYTGHVPQATGYSQQNLAPTFSASNPYYQQQHLQSIQLTSTNDGFGGFTSQPSTFSPNQPNLSAGPQNSTPVSYQNATQQIPMQGTQPALPQTTKPFDQSTKLNTPGISSLSSNINLHRRSTNPFVRQDTSSPHISTSSTSSFQSSNTLPFQNTPASSIATTTIPSQFQSQPQLLASTPTGKNPFVHRPPGIGRGPDIFNPNATQPQSANQPSSLLMPNSTGSTNPFRKSILMNAQGTGQSWQSAPQGTIGGFEQLDTIQVFPRPGQPAL